MNLTKKLIIPIILALTISACSKDEIKNNITSVLTIPSFYDSSNYSTNTASILQIRTNFDGMVTEIKKGRILNNPVSADLLTANFSNGNPSIETFTTVEFANQLKGDDGWFKSLVNLSENTYSPDSLISKGGVFGGYLFNANGVEPEQIIEKGLFGAALVNQVIQLLSNNPTLISVDKALFLVGATPHFKNSGNAIHGVIADKYLANYVARRDKNDGNGFYSSLKFNFIKLQAAIKGGDAFNNNKNEAIAKIKMILEEANYATVINYCHSSIANLSKTTLTETEKAATLHALNECVGFSLGWKNVNGKKITDTQIDEIITLLNMPASGGGKPALFITDRVNQITKLQTIIDKIKTIYGFSNSQIDDFKKNWVAEQAR